MKQEIETEIYSAQESFDLIYRRPNYVTNVIGLYALSFFGHERGRLMRASYLPIRKVDDALDGDAPKIKNPLQYATVLRDNIAKNQFGKSPEEKLLQYSLSVLELKAKPDDNPRGDFVRAIDAIIFDYERASKRSVLTSEGIEQYYRNAFDPIMNITLLAIDSNLRSGDIPVLSYGQGRVYSARDFETDWTRGIINVPQDVISSVGLSSNSSFEEVSINHEIIDWLHQSLAQTKPELLTAQLLLQNLQEKQTRVVCNSLISSILKYINRHQL